MAYGSLNWFSVYGHVLATTGVAWMLCDVARPSRQEGPLSPWVQVRWYFVLLLTATSFGVGLGAAAAFPVVLFLLRPTAPDRLRVALRFASLFVVLPLAYVLQHRAFQAVSGIEIAPPFPAMSPASPIRRDGYGHRWRSLPTTVYIRTSRRRSPAPASPSPPVPTA